MPDYYGTGIYGTATYDSIPAITLPVNTVAPAVTGPLTIGQSLATDNGTWTNAGTGITYTYQWQSSPDGLTLWGNLSGATSSSYTLQTTDATNYFRCVVTNTDSEGATAANSNVVGPAVYPLPFNTVAPVISGTAQVGAILAATSGTWNDDGSPMFSYVWQDSPDGITGWGNISTGNLYSIEDSRQNEYIQCVVTNTDSGGSASATSNILGPVTSPPIVGLSLTPHPVRSVNLTSDTAND